MIGTLLQGRYRLDAEIGRGGLGVVFRAHDTLLDRDVAVKVLSPATMAADAQARLLREAQAVARLHHPNIVTVFDAGESAGVPFIVMELVEGASLHDRPPQAMPDILALAMQICAALDHAHAHGIIHRDLKPENVVLGADGVVKLMDFGLARSVVSRLTAEGTIVGTVFYMAPEQALGQAIDQRTDLYALGVMLYELVAGRLPFVGDDPLAVISQHVNAPVVPPSAYNAQVPAALDALIVRLLSKRPDDRPASAAEARQALANVEASPAPAQEVPLLERIGRGRLVARGRELSEMEAIWRRAVAGKGHVLLVSGEPGVGKTRIVRELMIRAQVGGGKALLGASYAESGAPYAPMAEIIRQSLTSADGPSLPDSVLADLLTLAPDLRARYPNVAANPRLDPQSEQQRVFESVVAWCSALAAKSPVMLVFDDAHWADSGTLLLMQHLARRTRNQRLLIVAAYREVELDEARPWHQLLVDLNRERLSTRVKLGRLSCEQTRDLLASIFKEEIPQEFLDGIYRETEGNPFFVEEVCKALIEEGILSFRDGRWQRGNMDDIHVPQSVRIAIQMRVGKLSQTAQDTLRLAAVLGRQFEYEILKKASDLDEDALIVTLEDAQRAQLIGEVAGQRADLVQFSFAHALIASTLREGVGGLRRQRLHRRAAAALESVHPESYEALAYHCLQGGDVDRSRGFHLLGGERSLALYAWREAAESFRAALDLGGSPNERARALAGLGEALSWQGHLEDAVGTWADAIELCRSLGDYDRLAWLYNRSCRTLWDADQSEHALALTREGLAAVEGQPETEGIAALVHEAARVCYFSGLLNEARRLCERALRAAEELHSPEVEAQALSTMGNILGAEGRWAESVATQEKAARVAEAAGLLLTAARAYNNLAVCIGGQTVDLKRQRDFYMRSAELNRRARAPSAEAFSLGGVIRVSFYLADLAQLEEALRRQQQLVDSVVDPGQAQVMLECSKCYLHMLRGEIDEAISSWRQLLAEAQRGGVVQNQALATLGLAECLALAKTGYDEAEAALLALIPLTDKLGWSVVPRCFLSIVYVHQGQCDRAESWLDEARKHAGDNPAPGQQESLLWAEAALRVCQRDWPAACAGFERLCDWEARMGYRLDHAHRLVDWADAHLARGEAGDSERARELLQQALALYEDIGSTGYIARVRERLAAI